MNHSTHLPAHSRPASPNQNLPRVLTVLRWTARIASLASIALIAMMATDTPKLPTLQEAAALALFPIGVVAGMIWSWWRERNGAILSLSCLAAFYAYMFISRGNINLGPYFLIFSAPAFIFLICGLLASSRAAKH